MSPAPEPARGRRRLLKLALIVLVAGVIQQSWPMLRLGASGLEALGLGRTWEVFDVLLDVGRWDEVLNLRVPGGGDDPFGPRLAQLEAKRADEGLSAAEEQEHGNLLLRRGDPAAAVASFERAVAASGPGQRRAFDLGLANLRLAETHNCTHGSQARTCVVPVTTIHARAEATRAAAGAFLDAVETDDSSAGRWLLNLSHMLVGSHPEEVPERYRMQLPALEEAGPLPSFDEVARDAGVGHYDAGRGAALGDFDGDGRVDVIASGMWGGLAFFHNDGGGRFSDWTERSGLDGVRNTFIVVAADYDDDGLLDLYATRLFMWGALPNVLLHNEGGGRFRDVTAEAGVTCPGASMGAAWADYDLDGDVDLFVANTSDAAPLPFGLNPVSFIGRTPNALFRNDGDGSFTDVAAEAGVDHTGLYLGAVWGDPDADGRPDLYVSQFFGPNLLLRNRGDGGFDEIAAEVGVEAPFCSFTSWFWDYDGDGHLDILATAWVPLSDSIDGLVGGVRDASISMQLHRNRGDGSFENRTVAAGLDRAHGTMAGSFGDIDNDGFLDFALGTGSPQLEYVMPNAVYHNDGDGSFTEVARQLGMAHLQKGHGYAFGDLDDDGAVDIYLPIGGGYPGDGWTNALYRNDGPVGHWLAVELEGARRGPGTPGSNRAAIGARLLLTAGGRTRVAEVSAGSGFGSNPLTQHFGLGEKTVVERLEISWPASGTRQVFVDIPADQRIAVTELGEEWRAAGGE